MNALESFYNTIEVLMGPTLAKQTTTDALYIIISEMQDEGFPITADEMNKRLQTYTDDFRIAARDVIG